MHRLTTLVQSILFNHETHTCRKTPCTERSVDSGVRLPLEKTRGSIRLWFLLTTYDVPGVQSLLVRISVSRTGSTSQQFTRSSFYAIAHVKALIRAC